MHTKACNSEAWDIEKASYFFEVVEERAVINFYLNQKEFPIAMRTLALLIHTLEGNNVDSEPNLKIIRSLSISNQAGALCLSSKLINRDTFLALMSDLGFNNSEQLLDYDARVDVNRVPNKMIKRSIQNQLADLPQFDLGNFYYKLLSTSVELQVGINHIPSALFTLSKQKNDLLEKGIDELNSLSIHMDCGQIILTHTEGNERLLMEGLQLLCFGKDEQPRVPYLSHDAQTSLTPIVVEPALSEPVLLGKRPHPVEKNLTTSQIKRKRGEKAKIDWSQTICEQEENRKNSFIVTNDTFSSWDRDLLWKALRNFMRSLGVGYEVCRLEGITIRYAVEIDEEDFDKLQQERPGVDFGKTLEEKILGFANPPPRKKKRNLNLIRYDTYTSDGVDIALVECPNDQLAETISALRWRLTEKLCLKDRVGIAVPGNAGFKLLLIAKQRLPKSLADYLKILKLDSAHHTVLTKEEASDQVSAYMNASLRHRVVCKHFISLEFFSTSEARVVSKLDLKKDAMGKEIARALLTFGFKLGKKDCPLKIVEKNDELHCCFSEDLVTNARAFSQFLKKLGIKSIDGAGNILVAGTDTDIEIEEAESEERGESEELVISPNIPQAHVGVPYLSKFSVRETRPTQTKDAEIPYCQDFQLPFFKPGTSRNRQSLPLEQTNSRDLTL